MSTRTLGTPSSAVLVNADQGSPALGIAVLSVINAQIAERKHLRDGFQSFQYDASRGVGVLMTNAGARQHLASALGFLPSISAIKSGSHTVGAARKGHIFGIEVTIWNLENSEGI